MSSRGFHLRGRKFKLYLLPSRLRYTKYLKDYINDPVVNQALKYIRESIGGFQGKNLGVIVRHLTYFIKERIGHYTVKEGYFSPSEMVRLSVGNCLSMACLIYLVLFKLSFTESYVLILKPRSKDNTFLHHAIVIVFDNRKMKVIDPDNIPHIKVFRDIDEVIEKLGVPICLFNHEVAYICMMKMLS